MVILGGYGPPGGLLRIPIFLTSILVFCVLQVYAESSRVTIERDDGVHLPGAFFLPRDPGDGAIPGVVVVGGAGGIKLVQYRSYCQRLADRSYAVLLIDGSNFPQWLTPGADTARTRGLVRYFFPPEFAAIAGTLNVPVFRGVKA